MKRLSFLLLLVLFLSCEKDEMDESAKNGFVKIIESSETSFFNNDRLVFVYDKSGRLISLNDTLYFYGDGDRVVGSRYYNEKNSNGYRQEVVIKKSYKWDAQNRIYEIQVDSNYQKLTSPEGGIMESNPKPFIEAHFYYTGTNALPDSIAEIADSSPFVFQRFYHQDDNISRVESMANVYIKLGVSLRYASQTVDYQYNNTKNHLYPLFKKLGFLPKGFGYIVSKNNPTTSVTMSFAVENSLPTPPNIKTIHVLRSKFDYSYTSAGFPSFIKTEREIDFGNGFGQASPYSLYVYY
jgi:hypothetical protein